METVSQNLNRLHHSLKLIHVFVRYSFVALSSSIIDFIVFMVAQYCGVSLGLSFIFSRGVSLSYNFPMSRRFVFQSQRSLWIVAVEYFTLAVTSGYLCFAFTRLLVHDLSMAKLAAKLIAELTLFVINFSIQKIYIFIRDKNESLPT